MTEVMNNGPLSIMMDADSPTNAAFAFVDNANHANLLKRKRNEDDVQGQSGQVAQQQLLQDESGPVTNKPKTGVVTDANSFLNGELLVNAGTNHSQYDDGYPIGDSNHNSDEPSNPSETNQTKEMPPFNGVYYVKFDNNQEFSNYRMVLQTSKGDIFKTLFGALSDKLTSTALFCFGQDSIVIVGQDVKDGSYVTFTQLFTQPIEHYYCPLPFSMRLNMEQFAFRLSLIENNSSQTLTLKASRGKLDIDILDHTSAGYGGKQQHATTSAAGNINGNSSAGNDMIQKTYKYTLLEIDENYNMEIPETNIVHCTEIEWAWFERAIKNLENVDDSGNGRITFTINRTSFTASVITNGRVDTALSRSVPANQQTLDSSNSDNNDEELSMDYSLELLKKCCGIFKKLKSVISFKFGQEGMLFFEQDLTDDAAAHRGVNRVIIAPLLTDESGSS